MRIAFFTESLLPLVDGVSLTLTHLFDDLEERGIEFRVYSPFTPPPELPWADRVHTLPSVRFPLYTDYRLSIPWGQGLGAELDGWRPDLVHVTSPTPMAGWARRYANRRGIPLVATFHTHFVAYFRYYGFRSVERFGWWLLRRAYRSCRMVFTPSEAIATELRQRGIGPVRIWSRGVDTELFSPARRDRSLREAVGADEQTPILLMVSRLVKEKDLLDLPPMVRRLEAAGHAFRLVLVGDGPLRSRLESELPDAAFVGYQSGTALSRWYASGDVFVFPSTTETFGNVVQEALASGVPAVVSDRGGPQTVIEPGASGLVARANDPAHFAEQVGRLLADPERRAAMGRAARKQTEGQSWHRVNEQLLDGYRAVLERGETVVVQRDVA
ncbi:MAG: glycosyltransferase family 4 protein [Gemmatimonadota bacterium]